jgi:hypothetical protein
VIDIARHRGEPRRTFRFVHEHTAVYSLRVMARLAAETHTVFRGGTATHARLRDRLVALAIATLGFDLLCAVLALVFEHGQRQTAIHSFGSALFWTTTQLLTVSSQLRDPISTPARILDVVLEVYAITVIGSLAGAFGAFLVKRGEELDAAARAAAPR